MLYAESICCTYHQLSLIFYAYSNNVYQTMLVHGSRRFSFQKSVTCIDEDVCITKSVSMDQAQVID